MPKTVHRARASFQTGQNKISKKEMKKHQQKTTKRDEMVILSKYQGICSECGKTIKIDTRIKWSPGKARHFRC